MRYIKITLRSGETDVRDMLVASLTEAGFEGFEETDSELLAYIPERSFDEEELRKISASFSTAYSIEVIPEQNWNAQWEENFQPVVVEGFCTIRAHFHSLQVQTPYEIVITPKMSFGTGHHATTQLMMLQMRNMELKQKAVLDFGTGTGILAILAEKLGAGSVLAIDNDEWSFENAVENVKCNNCANIVVKLESQIGEDAKAFDIILANINRHILLEYMPSLYDKLNSNGTALMSGLLKEDEEIIVTAANAAGFRKVDLTSLDNWIALCFEKM